MRFQRTLSVLLHVLLPASSAFAPLSPSALAAIPRPADSDFNVKTGAILAPILVPRVPGTPGSAAVLEHLSSFFSTHLPHWHLELHNSTSPTPLSAGAPVPFTNLIATRDPPWAVPGDTGRFVLAAHYDSKPTPQGFIGATDSAVPVAVILHAVRALDSAMSARWSALDELERDDERGLMVMLLDGEEAWESWSDDDSLYGARALAEEWEGAMHAAGSVRRNRLADLELFVLLDLLGAKDPKVPSYFPTTHWAYREFAAVEKELRDTGRFKSTGGRWFHEADKTRGWWGGMVGDDHVPFMQRGVEVLHLIPNPFPRVWHTMDDNADHLDMDTVGDWGVLVTAWTAGMMGLGEFLEKGKAADGAQKRDVVRTEL